MSDSPPNIINIRKDGSLYPYFQFVLAILHATIFGNALQPVIHCYNIPPGFDLEAHNLLVHKFTSKSYVKNDTTALTLAELIYLMTAIDKISKTLLGDDAEYLNGIMTEQIPNLSDTWDKDFLKGAQIMFQSFEQLFKNVPEYALMLHIVTGQSGTAEV